MSGILAKLFPDMNNMDGFLKIVNELADDDESAPEKVAELSRKHKDILERKSGDVESFLFNCNANIGSAAMAAAIKALFDTSATKNFEQGTDRAVELLKHYIDNKKFTAAHLRLVPEIAYPLIRNSVNYCLTKKNEPNIGLELALSGMSLLVDPSERIVSSVHSSLFAVCLKLDKIGLALPYIYPNVKGLVNENWKPSNQPEVSDSCRKMRGSISNAQYFESKYMLLYLYYGALILIKNNELSRALAQLENAILLPGNAASLIQIDALKKYYIVSLMAFGRVSCPSGRSSALMRVWKSKGEAYVNLAIAAHSSGDKAMAVEKVLVENQELFDEDQNVGLIRRLIRELRIRAVLSVAKSFSSIRLADLASRAHIDGIDQTVAVIQNLVKSGKLIAEISIDEGIVRLDVPAQKTSGDTVKQRMQRLEELQWETERMDVLTQMNPQLLQRSLKNTFAAFAFNNDDEGLSMSSSPLEV